MRDSGSGKLSQVHNHQFPLAPVLSQSTLRSQIAIVAIILLLVGCLALLVDVPLAVWMADKPLHKKISRILHLAEFAAMAPGQQ